MEIEEAPSIDIVSTYPGSVHKIHGYSYEDVNDFLGGREIAPKIMERPRITKNVGRVSALQVGAVGVEQIVQEFFPLGSLRYSGGWVWVAKYISTETGRETRQVRFKARYLVTTSIHVDMPGGIVTGPCTLDPGATFDEITYVTLDAKLDA